MVCRADFRGHTYVCEKQDQRDKSQNPTKIIIMCYFTVILCDFLLSLCINMPEIFLAQHNTHLLLLSVSSIKCLFYVCNYEYILNILCTHQSP